MAALLRAKGAAKKPSAHGHGHSHGHGQGYPHTRAPEHGASASKYAFEEDMEMNLLPGGLASPEKELRPLVSDTRTPTVGEPGPRQMSSELCADAAMVPRRNLVGEETSNPDCSGKISSQDEKFVHEADSPLPPQRKRSATTLHHDMDLSQPPTTPTGETLEVEFRIVVLRVANVSTVEYTADIRFSVVFEWRDPRLGGVDFGPWGQPLPGHLWGPTLMLGNSVAQPTIVQTGCSLVDEKDRELVMRLGPKIKRQLVFETTVTNHMSLESFPFDIDVIECNFMCTGDWSSVDQAIGGNAAGSSGSSYRLVPFKTGLPLFAIPGSFKEREWNLLGHSFSMAETKNKNTGSRNTFVDVNVHISRNSGYYFRKVMAPIWLLSATSFTVLIGSDPSEFEMRKTSTNDMLVAGCALMYVVNQDLPRLEFFSSLDFVVLTSLMLFVVQSFAVATMWFWCSGWKYIQENPALGLSGDCDDEDTIRRISQIVGIVLAAVYTFSQFLITVPAARRTAWRIDIFRGLQSADPSQRCLALEGLKEHASDLLSGRQAKHKIDTVESAKRKEKCAFVGINNDYAWTGANGRSVDMMFLAKDLGQAKLGTPAETLQKAGRCGGRCRRCRRRCRWCRKTSPADATTTLPKSTIE